MGIQRKRVRPASEKVIADYKSAILEIATGSTVSEAVKKYKLPGATGRTMERLGMVKDQPRPVGPTGGRPNHLAWVFGDPTNLSEDALRKLIARIHHDNVIHVRKVYRKHARKNANHPVKNFRPAVHQIPEPTEKVLNNYEGMIRQIMRGEIVTQVVNKRGLPRMSGKYLSEMGLVRREAKTGFAVGSPKYMWIGGMLSNQQVTEAAKQLRIHNIRHLAKARGSAVASAAVVTPKQAPTQVRQQSAVIKPQVWLHEGGPSPKIAIQRFVGMLLNGSTHSAREVIEAETAYKNAVESL